MGFTIPNDTTATTNPASYSQQAQPDKVDFDILVAGNALTGVITGGVITVVSGMTVSVTAGTGYISGTAISWNTLSGALTANGSNPLFYLIYATSGGLNDVAGTASGSPDFPNVPANSLALGVVYLPAATATITSAMILDKRVMISDPGSMGVLDWMSF